MIEFPIVYPLEMGGGLRGRLYVERTAAAEVPRGRVYVTVGGERLDQIVHAVYGLQSGAVEAVLTYNHGLGDQPYILPADVAIELPPLTATAVNASSREVALWG